MLNRYLDEKILKEINRERSCLILGPRQTGKTTLVNKVLSQIKKDVVEYPLQNPTIRLALESDPGKIIREIEATKNKPIVFIDEAQKVPAIFDSVQYLIDKGLATFILTGSSARKLRKSGVNLLPGRISYFHLDPFLYGEFGLLNESNIKKLSIDNINKIKDYSFEDSLVFGSLPVIYSGDKKERGKILQDYSEIYLEEEIRAEALSRNVGAFSRFLELAALESGTAPNFSKLSQESGVSQPTIKEFYQILDDTLVAHRVDPFLKSARKRVLSASRYYFFDLGVRNSLARFPLDKKLINTQRGVLFEHIIVLEIIRRVNALNKNYNVNYWRTSGGAEVDCVIDTGDVVIPIEIKASKKVYLNEIRGLQIFLNDYSKVAKHGYVITRGDRKEKITENITALPWQYL